MVDSEIGRECHSAEMRLEQEVGLKVRRVVVHFGDFDRYSIVYPLKEGVFVMSDWDSLELMRGRDDLEQAFELGRLFDRCGEGLDCDVRNVVEGCYHPEIVRKRVHLVLHHDTVGRDKVVQGRFDKLGQVVRDVGGRSTLQIVELPSRISTMLYQGGGIYPWILHQSSVEPSPSTPIHRILLILDCLRHNLRVEMIVHVVRQTRFDR